MFHTQERVIRCIFYICKLITCYPAPADLCYVSYIKANKVTKISQVKSYPLIFLTKLHNMGVYGLA